MNEYGLEDVAQNVSTYTPSVPVSPEPTAVNMWQEICDWHTQSGCTEVIRSWRTPVEFGWWLSHGEGEARWFWSDIEFFRAMTGDSLEEIDAMALATAIAWFTGVHDYEAVRS